jgi:hypothetical protein
MLQAFHIFPTRASCPTQKNTFTTKMVIHMEQQWGWNGADVSDIVTNSGLFAEYILVGRLSYR